jgi:AcrR family transcriptional regulator
MPGPGRPRDDSLDRTILEVAARQLADRGYEGMSVLSVASEAATTRQALYRRWPTKADLAAAAVASMTDSRHRRTDDPFKDLVRELADFRQGVSRPGGLSMVGTMLQTTTDAELRADYRTRIVEPRRSRLRTILERAVGAGLLDADGDVEGALTMLTGAWYGRALASDQPLTRWPERVAALVWRAMGGVVP